MDSENKTEACNNILHLIILLGFKNSGKTRLIDHLYKTLLTTTNANPDINRDTNRFMQADIMAKQGKKKVRMYFGLDGDDYNCVFGNMKRIATGSYDVAIIPLSRSILQYHPSLAISYIWEKWIDYSIANLSKAPTSIVFPGHKRYYVHTEVPQLCVPRGVPPDYTGKIASFSNPKTIAISALTERHIIDLIDTIV